jgi:hypothetical protein
LYKIEGKTKKCIKEWNNLSHVTKRNEIKVHEVFNMLEVILLDLNSYFINNELKKGKTIESIGNETFIELLFKNTGNLIDNLKANSRKDSKFELKEYLRGNAQFIADFIQERMPKVKYRIPEATYLGWLDFRAYGMTDQELWDFMCHKAKVATDDGPKFGPNGEAGGFQRINFSCPRAQLEEALNRIAEALDAL